MKMIMVHCLKLEDKCENDGKAGWKWKWFMVHWLTLEEKCENDGKWKWLWCIA